MTSHKTKWQLIPNVIKFQLKIPFTTVKSFSTTVIYSAGICSAVVYRDPIISLKVLMTPHVLKRVIFSSVTKFEVWTVVGREESGKIFFVSYLLVYGL